MPSGRGDALEKVRLAQPEPVEWKIRIPQERPQHPANLRADELEYQNPDSETRLDVRSRHRSRHRVQRARRVRSWQLRGFAVADAGVIENERVQCLCLRDGQAVQGAHEEAAAEKA